MRKRIHQNSLSSHRVIENDGSLGKRAQSILDILTAAGRPLTDYEVLQKFKPGSDNLNLVRPRITELTERGFLAEGPARKSHAKNCNVRASRVIKFRVQQSLFA